MLNILIKCESRYKVDRKRIKKAVKKVIDSKNPIDSAEVSISIVGDRKMRTLNRNYRKIDRPTDVLSFPLNEQGYSGFVDPPDSIIRLGDIVISYPMAVSEAGDENKMVDDKINELVEHGMLHLLGYHHD